MTAATPCKRDILVVDDDPDIRETVREILEREGYNVRAAWNGEEALEMLGESTPCVMLLDMMMPVMSGPEVLIELERTHRLRSLPVVVVSAHMTQCEGVRQVLKKPVSLDRLLEVVGKYCETQDPSFA
jgi:CheY-like chemotaxis protein